MLVLHQIINTPLTKSVLCCMKIEPRVAILTSWLKDLPRKKSATPLTLNLHFRNKLCFELYITALHCIYICTLSHLYENKTQAQ